MNEKDRDVLRFLWAKNLEDDVPQIMILHFNRVTFGVGPSPFLLNATLRHHLSHYEEADPKLIQKLGDSFHIDDLTTGEEDDQSAFDLYKKSKTCLEEGSFHLRKWHSNSDALMEMIKADRLKTESLESNSQTESHETLEDDQSFAKMNVGDFEEFNPNHETKILGLPWNCADDTFVFKFEKILQSAENLSPTKQNVLSVASRLFVPLGICGPIFVRVKILLQDICHGKHDRDTPLPKHLEIAWKKLVK